MESEMINETEIEALFEQISAEFPNFFSVFGERGIEKFIAELAELVEDIRELRRRRARRLSAEQMIRAWATYRAELDELRARLQREEQADELQALVEFAIKHLVDELELQSGLHRRDPFQPLARTEVGQVWVVDWLRDVLIPEQTPPTGPEAIPAPPEDEEPGHDGP